MHDSDHLWQDYRMSQTSNHPPVPQPVPQPGSNQPQTPLVPVTHEGPKSRRLVPIVVVTALIAGCVGALGAYLVVESDTGQSDASIVCTNVGRFDLPLKNEDIHPSGPLLHELLGLSGYGLGAARGDGAHIELEEPSMDLLRAQSRVNLELMNESVARISTACETIKY